MAPDLTSGGTIAVAQDGDRAVGVHGQKRRRIVAAVAMPDVVASIRQPELADAPHDGLTFDELLRPHTVNIAASA